MIAGMVFKHCRVYRFTLCTSCDAELEESSANLLNSVSMATIVPNTAWLQRTSELIIKTHMFLKYDTRIK